MNRPFHLNTSSVDQVFLRPDIIKLQATTITIADDPATDH